MTFPTEGKGGDQHKYLAEMAADMVGKEAPWVALARQALENGCQGQTLLRPGQLARLLAAAAAAAASSPACIQHQVRCYSVFAWCKWQ